MSMTPDEMRTMLIELLTNKPPSLRGPEADAQRERFRKEIAEIKARGGTIVIPPEVATG